MKVLIEIDEEVYKHIKEHSGLAYAVEDYLHEVEWVVKNGTPLPKGYRDLIDRTELLKAMDTWPKFGLTIDGRLVPCKANVHLIPYVHYADMVQAVKGMPTIIEADKLESEDKE